MLKNITIILLFTLPAVCFGQTLFFDNLKNSVWTGEEHLNDVTILRQKEIGLQRLTTIPDSLPVNKTLWAFNDSLVLSYHNAGVGVDTVIARLKYEADKENSLLRIFTANKGVLTYKVGISSTNNTAILIRRKNKR
jgi:hypothetical protein